MSDAPIKPLPSVAEWGRIDIKNRITIPADVTDAAGWFPTKDKGIDLYVRTARPGALLLFPRKAISPLLELEADLLSESDSNVDGLRRLALARLILKPTKLPFPSRRVLLGAAAVIHLEADPPGRALCVGFSERVEIYSESVAKRLIQEHLDDLLPGDAL